MKKLKFSDEKEALVGVKILRVFGASVRHSVGDTNVDLIAPGPIENLSELARKAAQEWGNVITGKEADDDWFHGVPNAQLRAHEEDIRIRIACARAVELEKRIRCLWKTSNKPYKVVHQNETSGEDDKTWHSPDWGQFGIRVKDQDYQKIIMYDHLDVLKGYPESHPRVIFELGHNDEIVRWHSLPELGDPLLLGIGLSPNC
jgi:hypothetical protein